MNNTHWPSGVSSRDAQQTSSAETEELSEEPVEFDNVLYALGSPLRYQFLQVSMCILFYLPYVMAIYNFVFTGYEPPHTCAITNETEFLATHRLLNDTSSTTIVYDRCHIRLFSNATGQRRHVTSTGCLSGQSYEGGKGVSMKTEWNLVCQNEGMAELVQTMFSVGMLMAGIVLSPLSDRFGRKPVVITCSVVSTLLELCLPLSPSIYVVIFLRFLSGSALQHVGLVAYTMCAEILVTRHRDTLAMGSLFVWSLAVITLGGVSYSLSFYSWRVLQLVTALFGLLPLAFAYFINESLPWLFAKGRHAQALKIIQQACARNGSNSKLAEREYNECVQRLRRARQVKDKETSESTTEYGVVDIFRHRRLLTISLILCLTMFTINLTYYGMYLTSATFHVNRFFMFMILSLLEIPACVAFFVLLKYMGRRTIVLLFLVLTGICLLVSTCLVGLGDPSQVHVSNSSAAFFVLGKFAIDIVYNCVSSFLVEHFPTTLRGIGIGVCCSVGRIGGIASPFLYPLFVLVNWVPGCILVTICFITASLYTLMPETKGRELPTMIDPDDNTKEGTDSKAKRSSRANRTEGLDPSKLADVCVVEFENVTKRL